MTLVAALFSRLVDAEPVATALTILTVVLAVSGLAALARQELAKRGRGKRELEGASKPNETTT